MKIYIFFPTNIILIMDDPIKIIWKFKNNTRRVQYHQYIFIGNIAKDVENILNKIEDLNFYDTLIKLNKQEYTKLERLYGERWYLKFFNTYHINSTIYLIKESKTQRNELIEKYGKEWYNVHIEKHRLMTKKLIYSYETLIKDEHLRKSAKKGRTVAVVDDDIDVDYTTNKKIDIKKLFNAKTSDNKRFLASEGVSSTTATNSTSDSTQFGGGDDEIDTNEHDPAMDIEIDQNEEEDFDEGMEASDLLQDEEIDMEEIEKMYQDLDVRPDDDPSKTSNLIKKALDDEKLFDKKINQMVEFDQSKDTNIHDENLRDVYKKTYIKSQYIFKDDTVKTIREKICCAIKNNSKFDKDAYIIPSRQYLWGEYYFGDKIEKIMLGQKWMKRNELLTIDTEPNNNFRYYEELIGPLKLLKDNIRRYGNKIRREDDENNILYDYEDYIMNNEIYMIDLYNEFGLGYKGDSDALRNLQDVYLKIYFPRIRSEDVKYIVEYLNNDKKIEQNKITTIFETINNDLIMENEITNMVEDVKVHDKFGHIFKDNFITQSTIHVNLRITEDSKLDLFRIFNEFVVTDKYPFIQYQTSDGNIVYKFNEREIGEYLKKRENADVLAKWFENAPYGINIKVKVNDKGGEKFMAMTLNENARIEYKTQWKEENMATIEDISKTYTYVKDLIRKVNDEKNKIRFEIPDDSEFKYAFINTIQKFELPEKFIINHNDLSEFSRYFYPYVALVIEPRKRQAKVKKLTDTSKFGTYLRYRRVSKYDNQARMEQRIMYFMRNYEYTDQSLANEISKQFNITEDRALEEIEKVKLRYPNLKKSRKVLKKLENIPKYKPPGIGIDIQGKQRDKYKIRISGARDKEQLDRMILFMNILIYLYIETYLYKKPDRQILKDKLKKLNNIARRRSKVDDIVNYAKDIKTVKQMTQMDKRRIGFKPDKGQNQWTRSCQNSGEDKKRRPQSYYSSNIEEMLKKGYTLNKKTGTYERKVIPKGSKKELILKTVKLPDIDDEGNSTGNDIYYGCDPDENGDHVYIGFLTRSMNPNGLCMPCCFKKDPLVSKNKEKKEFFMRCLSQGTDPNVIKQGQKAIGDKLYILQDTNKIQEGRYGFLPKYLDFYFNHMLLKTKRIKNHYLVRTNTGYFFKYGSKQDEYQFLNAIGSILDMSVDDIKDKAIVALESDRNEQLFTSLNNGDIKTHYGTRENYISYIRYNTFLDFEQINNLITIPGVVRNNGLNIIIFQKKNIIIKKTFEKEKMREDFTVNCQDIEDIYNIMDPKRESIFMIKENKNYYPIVMVKKDDESSKTMDTVKTFTYEDDKDNIVHHIKDFYEKNCHGTFMDNVVYHDSALIAKDTYNLLVLLQNPQYKPKFQLIDVRNKCKYMITSNNLIVPVRPSGSIYNLQIVKSIDRYIAEFKQTIDKLQELYKITEKRIPVKPIGVYFDKKTGDKLRITGIITMTKDVVPVKPEEFTIKAIEALNLRYENKPLTDKIDQEIAKGKNNYKVDSRMLEVNYDKYHEESYELFRLEFSDYINRKENDSIKSKIEQIVNDPKMTKFIKLDKLRLLIYRLIDRDLYLMYKKIIDKHNIPYEEPDVEVIDIAEEPAQSGGKYDRLLHVATKVPDLVNYQVVNDRSVCNVNKTKDVCNTNPHCRWTTTGCYMSLTKDMIVSFVNKISEEIVSNDMKAFEIMRVGNYFVSDIVDYNRFTERDNQKIVRSSSTNIKKVLNELFGKDNTPRIGKRRISKGVDVNYQQLNINNPMIDMKDIYVQKIINKNMTIMRAYVNGYYWIRNSYNDVEAKNLGYYSPLQTELSNYFKSLIIDWLNDNKNKTLIEKELYQYMDIKRKSENPIHDFIMKISQDIPVLTNCIVELFILSKLNDIPIVVYDDDNNIRYIFDNGIVHNTLDRKYILSESGLKKYTDNKGKYQVINMRFSFVTNNKIPDEIEIIYFK